MHNGKFVIDAVTHAFDNRAENSIAGRYSDGIIRSNFDFQRTMMPERYRLSREQYYVKMSPELLASAVFAESTTDVAVYHALPTWGVFRDLSPIDAGMAVRDRAPGRMFLYAAVSPLEGQRAIEELERQAEEWGVCGVKLYPIDIIDGRMRSFAMSDETLMYPVLEKCRELGIDVVAIHKALPLGTAPMDPFRPDDVDYAARDFPDLKFEIVHGGLAFLEETSFQIERFDNVYVNLEATSQLLTGQPLLFAQILGSLLLRGGGKRIFWGTGAPGAGHPRPLLEAFEAFEMPVELMDGMGYPEVTDEIKADILGRNYASAHGWDIHELAAAIDDDEFAQRRAAEGLAEPWSTLGNPAATVADA